MKVAEFYSGIGGMHLALESKFSVVSVWRNGSECQPKITRGQNALLQGLRKHCIQGLQDPIESNCYFLCFGSCFCRNSMLYINVFTLHYAALIKPYKRRR